MPGLGQASVTDPWTGRECARVAQAGPRELEQALEGARLAAPRMAREPRHRRASLLAEISRLITRDRETLARLITAEAGKPIRFSKLEVERAARTFAIAATEARQSLATPWAADAEPGAENFVARTERFPLGPVVAITPFNFPLNLVAHKVAPALAAGNPVIVKPAPQAPSAALHLGRLVVEAGAPEGAISVVPCGPELAQGLVIDGRVRMLSFTGSAEVGWKLRALAAGKRCVLELGGNAAAMFVRAARLPPSFTTTRTWNGSRSGWHWARSSTPGRCAFPCNAFWSNAACTGGSAGSFRTPPRTWLWETPPIRRRSWGP